MAKIPLPERGQPLDVTYIYELANTINDISTQVSSATYKNSTIDTVTAAQQNLKTSELQIAGGFVEVANESTVSAGNERTFEYNFKTDFKFPPIVTASPINTGKTPAGQDVTVVLKPSTVSKVEGVVKFGASGNLSLNVNIIAIGIPN